MYKDGRKRIKTDEMVGKRMKTSENNKNQNLI